MRDARGAPVAGVGRLVVFSLVALVAAGVVGAWGFHSPDGRGTVAVVLAAVIIAGLITLWASIAVAQRRRSALPPPTKGG